MTSRAVMVLVVYLAAVVVWFLLTRRFRRRVYSLGASVLLVSMFGSLVVWGEL